MPTDYGDLGRQSVSPINQATRAQRVRITKVSGTDYQFVIPDITSQTSFAGEGPAGMSVGDVVFAIPTVQGDWFIIDPTRITLT